MCTDFLVSRYYFIKLLEKEVNKVVNCKKIYIIIIIKIYLIAPRTQSDSACGNLAFKFIYLSCVFVCVFQILLQQQTTPTKPKKQKRLVNFDLKI